MRQPQSKVPKGRPYAIGFSPDRAKRTPRLPLVKYLLFAGESPLTARIQGTSSFARDFAKQGPCDHRGRTLREFDLEKRMFRHPCSYLIYSDCFDALPGEVRSYVCQRLGEVLASKDKSKDFQHLSVEDRQAIREILLETKPDLLGRWCDQPASQSEK